MLNDVKKMQGVFSAYQGTAKQWYVDTFPNGIIAGRLANALNTWSVGVRDNNFHNRLVVQEILESALVGVTSMGDLTTHTDITVYLASDSPASLIMTIMQVEIKSSHEGSIAVARLTLDTSTGKWSGSII